jgi:radical SAM superfamily enzyme YgiQ (UPF0313 family)
MPEILLTTLNAKYIHAAFGLRYLLANLGELRPRAGILEFDINQRPLDITERILAASPRLVGFGVYIWNVAQTTEVISLLKRLAPDIRVIIGGPEVSFELEDQEIVKLADYVITGEADLEFGAVCEQVLSDRKPTTKILPAPLPDFSKLRLPYHEYTADDVAHRIIYVEASRGCPFTCEFCLSSLDVPVRQAPLDLLLVQLQALLDRGVTQFKFVDRTFNLSAATSQGILEFFLERHRPGLFLHFELIPDRLPPALKELIRRFPPAALQFEVGIQTFNPETAALIKRRQNYERLAENLTFLRNQTGVHIHADLIVGLPGEDIKSFGAGFDQLVALNPQEIQVGILKRLRGTPISRHDSEWQMIYSPTPPYEILSNRGISFAEMQGMRRLARYWDLVANSGNFLSSTPLLWEKEPDKSPFAAFSKFSEWLHFKTGRGDGIALVRLAELIFEYLSSVGGHDIQRVASSLWDDYRRPGRRDIPEFLRRHIQPGATARHLKSDPGTRQRSLAKRQARHLQGSL